MYRLHRAEPVSTRHVHAHKGHDHCCSGPAPAAAVDFAPVSSGAQLSRFRIEAMDCPTEQTLIQNKLAKLAGVEQLEFNLVNRVLGVRHVLDSTAPIEQAIASLGMTAVSMDGDQPLAAQPKAKAQWPLWLSGLAAVGAEVLHFTGLAPTWAIAGVALLSIVAGGLGTYKKGWIALKNRNLNINALMSIAVTGALLIGQWPEAAMVMFLFTVAELIEARSLSRARDAIAGLLQLAPQLATVLGADGQWQDVAVSSIEVGARVRVRPGERIAVDGEVVHGRSSIDQAAITGESLPVDKTTGDKVFAGTLNQAGSLEVLVTAPASQSTLARIIHAVEQAQGAKAPTQRFVDNFARVYTPLVFVLALGVAVLPPLLLAGAWFEWIYRALVLLVVACPCALVISTPVTLVSGLAAAARKGILIKGGAYLESGYRLQVIALDKTGTLTYGKPRQTDFERWVDGPSDVAQIAASLAARSDHPVSMAIAAANAQARLEVQDFAALPGRGVRGEVNGQSYHLGNPRLAQELGATDAQLIARLEQLEREGKSLVLLLAGNQALALFAVADTVKDTSKEAIAELHALGIKTLMLTGDNQHTAEAVARQVGIDQARGNLLPADKLAAIEALDRQGHATGMVGDGINDAPALARASIGFAMGAAGSHTAIETADVALMDDDLRKLPAFVRLSRQTRAILAQNIGLALVVKALFLGLTFAGLATMWMAVFADMGVSLLVVFNGLRLLRK